MKRWICSTGVSPCPSRCESYLSSLVILMGTSQSKCISSTFHKLSNISGNDIPQTVANTLKKGKKKTIRSISTTTSMVEEHFISTVEGKKKTQHGTTAKGSGRANLSKNPVRYRRWTFGSSTWTPLSFSSRRCSSRLSVFVLVRLFTSVDSFPSNSKPWQERNR